MLKLAVAVSVAALFAITPASAVGKLKCGTASMKKVDMMIEEAMKDPAMKKQEKMAMEESEMAIKLKKKGDFKGCAMHLNMAQDALMDHG